MSYCIYVRSRSKKLVDKMEDFIIEHLQSFYKLYNNSDDELFYFGLDTGTVYAKSKDRKFTIGFDVRASGGERYYVFELIYWMASKIAKNTNVYYHDGDETKIPKSYEEMIYKEAMNIKTNPEYWLRKNIEYNFSSNEEFKKIKKVVADEIERLDNLWK